MTTHIYYSPLLPETESNAGRVVVSSVLTRSVLRRHMYVLLCLLLHVTFFSSCFAVAIYQCTSNSGVHYTTYNWALYMLFGTSASSASGGVNAVIKACIIVLTSITQALSIKQLLHCQQSLTAVHDRSSAWLGLPSAGLSLIQYRDIFYPKRRKQPDRPLRHSQNLRSGAGVLAIVLYLLCAAAIEFIAPRLVFVQFDDLSLPQNLDIMDVLDTVGQDADMMKGVFPVLKVWQLDEWLRGWVQFKGLDTNFIYNPPVYATRPKVQVTGTQVIAACNPIPDVTGRYDDVERSFAFHIDDALEDIYLMPASLKTVNVRSLKLRNTPASITPATMFVTVPWPFADSDGINGTQTLLDRAVKQVLCPTPNHAWMCGDVNTVMLLGCNFHLRPMPLPYNTLQSSIDYTYAGDPSPMWANWTMPPPLSLVAQIPDWSPVSPTTISYRVGEDTTIYQYTITQLEDSVSEFIGMYSVDESPCDIGSINNALEAAVSAILWQASTTQIHETNNKEMPSHTEPRLTVSFDLSMVLLATILSFAMMILAAILMWRPFSNPRKRTEKEKISGLGVLGLTWLLSQDPRITAQFASIKQPTQSELRETGKDVDWCFADSPANERIA